MIKHFKWRLVFDEENIPVKVTSSPPSVTTNRVARKA